MSTTDRERTGTLPPLVAGERLDRATFHARYEAMPPETRAELIGGVVVMMSPASPEHGDMAAMLAGWLKVFTRGIPALRASVAPTVLLDDEAEPEPDVLLRILPEYGGQTHLDGGYLAGAPELVVEVSRTTRRTDLGPKRDDYGRAGVREYLVVTLHPAEVHWFVRRHGRFERLDPGTDGLYRSEVFPGLWLDPNALFAGDDDALWTAVERGKATPEHAAFAAQLAARNRQP